ncbi:Beta-glucuronidase [Aphelenchoides bicaudatus]|nr:Beta-glucuronidase [Aphelenchoides bicaudatus]
MLDCPTESSVNGRIRLLTKHSTAMLFRLLFANFALASGLLYPQRNEIRGLDSLDGLWTFVREPKDYPGIGLQNEWFKQNLAKFPNATKMPVPTAFNELSPERDLRLHVGWVWYQTTYYTQPTHQSKRLILRFGSVNYYAQVFVNGKLAKTHVGGHLPFDVELFDSLSTRTYQITVAVNNTLHSGTIPPGDLKPMVLGNSSSYTLQIPNFDFFNYAGILRPVSVQVLNSVFLSSLKIFNIAKNQFTYTVETSSLSKHPAAKISVCLLAPDNSKVKCVASPKQFDPIENVELWWPRGYGEQPLYTLEVTIYVNTEVVDIYRETFGFRTVALKDGKLTINDKPFYCIGFGMHEDSDLHGRGYDPVVMTRDLNMMNANCYRTSHYPYSEERAYEADRRGIVTITETPAVGLRYFNAATLKVHENMLREMIERDFNHPSIIAWSLTNEPETHRKESRSYFQRLVNVAKSMDQTRLITTVYGPSRPFNDQTADLFEIICINRYDGWYQNMDHPEIVDQQMYEYVKNWSDAFKKPIIAAQIPFSEQYQIELIRQNHRAFDRLARDGVITGEMIWNFADFMTAASVSRPLGNHKGVLTRSREPKMSAYVIKERYGVKNATDWF